MFPGTSTLCMGRIKYEFQHRNSGMKLLHINLQLMFLNQIFVSETKTIQNFWKKVMHIVRKKRLMCIVERKKPLNCTFERKEKKKTADLKKTFWNQFQGRKKKNLIASHHQHTSFIYLLIINFEKKSKKTWKSNN